MKKLLLAVIIPFALFACDDNDDSQLPPETFTTAGLVTEVNISDIQGDFREDQTKVSFVARYYGQSNGINPNGDGHRGVLLTVPYNKSGMRITLPANPPQECMRNLVYDIPAGFTISDPEARAISFTEFAYHSEEDEELDRIGDFFDEAKTYGELNYKIEYMYCDRPTTVTGKSVDWWSNPTTYDLKLEKGWNKVIRQEDNSGGSRTVTVSNQLPDNVQWRWNRWIGGR